MLAPLAVDLDPFGNRLDPFGRADRRRNRGTDVGPGHSGHAAEERRPERGAGVDRDPVERQLQRRGDDSQPLLAPGTAPRDAPGSRLRS